MKKININIIAAGEKEEVKVSGLKFAGSSSKSLVSTIKKQMLICIEL